MAVRGMRRGATKVCSRRTRAKHTAFPCVDLRPRFSFRALLTSEIGAREAAPMHATALNYLVLIIVSSRQKSYFLLRTPGVSAIVRTYYSTGTYLYRYLPQSYSAYFFELPGRAIAATFRIPKGAHPVSRHCRTSAAQAGIRQRSFALAGTFSSGLVGARRSLGQPNGPRGRTIEDTSEFRHAQTGALAGPKLLYP